MTRGWKNFFDVLGNYGKATADSALSIVGAGSVIDDKDYKGNSAKFFDKVSDIQGQAIGTLAPMAANILLPGSGVALKGIQTGVSGALSNNSQQTGQGIAQAGIQGANMFNNMQQANQYGDALNALGSLNIMPYGGYNMSPVQLEKQEVYQMPNGMTGQVDGPSHKGGGVNMMMPEMSRVFSDRLKYKKGMTYAKEAEKYKTDKWQKMLDNPNTDSFGKTTAKRMLDMSNKKLDMLFNHQEMTKQMEGINDDGSKKNGGNIPQYPGGGTIPAGQPHPLNPSYRSTGIYDIKTGEQIYTGPRSVRVPDSQVLAPTPVKPSRPATEAGPRYSGQAGYDPNTGVVYSKMPAGGTTDQFTPYQDPITGKWIQNLNVQGNLWYRTEADRQANKPATKPAIMQDANGNWIPYVPPVNTTPQQFAGGGLNFKSGAAYKAWLAYGHASGEFAKTPGHQKVSIKGKSKNVEHAMGGYHKMPDGSMMKDSEMMYQGGGLTPELPPAEPTSYYDYRTGQVVTNPNFQPSYGTESYDPFPASYDPTIQSIGYWNTPQNVPTNYSGLNPPQNPSYSQQYQPVNPASLYRTSQGLTPMTINDPAVPTGGFQQPNLQSRNPYGMKNANIPQTLSEVNPMAVPDPRATPVKDYLQSINPYFTAGTVGNFLGPAYDIYRGLKGPDEVNFERVNPELVNYEEARRQGVQETNRGFNLTRKAIQEGTAGNAGTYLSNVGQAGALRDEGNRRMISQSLENERNINAQIRNQAKAQNAGIQQAESVARQQEKDIASNILQTGITNLGAALNQYGVDLQLRGNEPILKSLIATGDYDYIYSKNGKPIGIKSKVGNGKITGFTGLSDKQQKELQKLIDEAGKTK